MSKTKSYSLYLVKPDIEDFEDVFTEPAKEKIQAGEAVLRESDDLGDKAIVYIFPGPPSRRVGWLTSTQFSMVHLRLQIGRPAPSSFSNTLIDSSLPLSPMAGSISTTQRLSQILV